MGGYNMPSAYVGKIAKKKGITKDRAEHLWNKAKNLAADEGHEEEWDYITGIFKRMVGESLTFKEFCAILGEDGEPTMSVSGGGMDHHDASDGKKSKMGKMARRKKKCENDDCEDETLTEATKEMSMTSKFYDEMFALEVDTLDEYSPKGKEAFAKAIEKAKKKGSRYIAQLSPEAVKYALSSTGAIYNSMDIWAGNNQRLLIKQGEKIAQELKK